MFKAASSAVGMDGRQRYRAAPVAVSSREGKFAILNPTHKTSCSTTSSDFLDLLGLAQVTNPLAIARHLVLRARHLQPKYADKLVGIHSKLKGSRLA